ncbi:DNA/RNA non-specific endonuclease [Saccharopolyspora cebuensis]|uniref:WXG100-like domain-containing protein n=1 Tax=Saccharopolyspora cebuensis TaxID=418759 RepID=UPI0031EC693A
MSIEMPEEIKWLVPLCVGQSWPEGDEDAMRRMADAWRAAAEGVDGVQVEANRGAEQTKGAMRGRTADSFTDLWKDIGDGDEAALPQLKKACEQLAEACDNAALEVEHTKLTIIATMIALAAQIAAMIAAAPFTFGASTAGIAAAQGVTRVVVMQIFRQLIINIAIEMTLSLGIELAVQSIQIASGERDGYDLKKFGEAAISGAIGGVVGGLFDGVGGAIGRGIGGAAGDSVGGSIVKEGITGAAEGTVSSVAEQLIMEGEIDPGNVGMAAASGGFTGGVMGGVGAGVDNINVPDVPDADGGGGDRSAPGPGDEPPPGTDTGGSDSPTGDRSAPSDDGPAAPPDTSAPPPSDDGATTGDGATPPPASETPAPDSSTPETPAPETPAPETPAPETPTPESPAPDSSTSRGGDGATTPPAGDTPTAFAGEGASGGDGATTPPPAADTSSTSPAPEVPTAGPPPAVGGTPTPPSGGAGPGTPAPDTSGSTPPPGDSTTNTPPPSSSVPDSGTRDASDGPSTFGSTPTPDSVTTPTPDGGSQPSPDSTPDSGTAPPSDRSPAPDNGSTPDGSTTPPDTNTAPTPESTPDGGTTRDGADDRSPTPPSESPDNGSSPRPDGESRPSPETGPTPDGDASRGTTPEPSPDRGTTPSPDGPGNTPSPDRGPTPETDNGPTPGTPPRPEPADAPAPPPRDVGPTPPDGGAPPPHPDSTPPNDQPTSSGGAPGVRSPGGPEGGARPDGGPRPDNGPNPDEGPVPGAPISSFPTGPTPDRQTGPSSTTSANVDAPPAPPAAGPLPTAPPPRGDQPAPGGGVTPGPTPSGPPPAGPTPGGAAPGGPTPGCPGRPSGPPPAGPTPGGPTPGGPTPGGPGRPGGSPGPADRPGGGDTPRQPDRSPAGPPPRGGTDTPRGPEPRPAAPPPRGPDAAAVVPPSPRPDGRPDSPASQDGPRPDPAPDRGQQIADAEAQRDSTPSGSSYHDDPAMKDLAQRVPDDGVHHTVDVHSTPDGNVRIGDQTFTPGEFADMIRNDPNWDGDKPIRLIACDSGSSGLARDLAADLGVPVTAPSGRAWTDNDGRVFSGDRDPNGGPGWPPNGNWTTHYPAGSTSRPTADGFHPPGSGTPDTRPEGAEDRAPGNVPPHSKPPYDPPPPWTTTVLNPTQPSVPYPGLTPAPQAPAAPPALPDPVTTWNRPPDSTFTRPPGHPDGQSPISLPDSNNKNKHLKKIGPNTPFSSLTDNPKKKVELAPNTRYDFPERGASFFTNGNGKIEWVEVDSSASGSKEVRGNVELRRDGVRPDAQYKIDGNWVFNTDSHGQTTKMSGTPHYKDSPTALPADRYYRDQTSQDHAGEEGRVVHPDWRWAGGHLAAHEAGGPGEYINMYPQRATSNSGHYREGMTNEASWRHVEDHLSSAHDRGSTINRIEVLAPRTNPDGIPVTAAYRWIETDKNGIVTVNHADFPNVANYNYGEWHDYDDKPAQGTGKRPADGDGSGQSSGKKSKKS